MGYAENTNGYRLFDLDASTIKMSRSVKLDEREIGGKDDTQLPQQETVIHVTKDSITESVPLFEEHQQTVDEPMEASVDDPVLDVEMNEVELDLEPRQSQLPPPEPTSTGQELTEYQPRPQAFLKIAWCSIPTRSGRGVPENLCSFLRMDRQHSDWSDGLPTPKRARIDEEGLLAEAVLAYAASIDGVPDTPNAYAEAIASDEAAEWRQAIDAELQSHARNQTWNLVPRGMATRPIGCR